MRLRKRQKKSKIHNKNAITQFFSFSFFLNSTASHCYFSHSISLRLVRGFNSVNSKNTIDCECAIILRFSRVVIQTFGRPKQHQKYITAIIMEETFKKQNCIELDHSRSLPLLTELKLFSADLEIFFNLITFSFPLALITQCA